MTRQAPFDVVAFGPHPDDVAPFCGGFVAGCSRRGQRVAIVDLSQGERASRGTVEERQKEAAAAAAVLGVVHRENLGFPDALIPARDDDAAPGGPLLTLVQCLRRLRPELVLVPGPRDRHPDHEAASTLITRAIFLAALARFEVLADGAPSPATTPRRVVYYPMRQLEAASFIVDISDDVETKRRAIACHQSQVGAPAALTPTPLLSSSLALPALAARDQFYGAQLGVAAGEPYVVREALGLVDPLQFFRDNDRGRAFFWPERS